MCNEYSESVESVSLIRDLLDAIKSSSIYGDNNVVYEIVFYCVQEKPFFYFDILISKDIS